MRKRRHTYFFFKILDFQVLRVVAFYAMIRFLSENSRLLQYLLIKNFQGKELNVLDEG